MLCRSRRLSVDGSDPSRLGDPCETSDCYTCGSPTANLPQANAEDVYSFACQVTGSVTVNLTNQTCDLDLYVLDIPGDPSACSVFPVCLEGATGTAVGTAVSDQLTFTCDQGTTYYIVVEHTEDSQAFCSYDLSFDAGAGEGCAEDCDDGIDNDLDNDTDCDDSDCASDPACSS